MHFTSTYYLTAAAMKNKKNSTELKTQFFSKVFNAWGFSINLNYKATFDNYLCYFNYKYTYLKHHMVEGRAIAAVVRKYHVI